MGSRSEAPTAHVRFTAMGTEAHLVAVGGDDRTLARGLDRVRQLERRWSRFVPDSEVSRLNGAAGTPVVVSPDTLDLVGRSVTGWKLTGGRFDPTIGAALMAWGYDRDFAELADVMVPGVDGPCPAPGLGGVQVDPALGSVTLPGGVVFDSGGIGKGLAADLVACTLLDAGARGALVSLGGDMRALGEPPTVDGWVITVPDPLVPAVELLRLSIPYGAVATSSRLERRWITLRGPAHHLIDPLTGRPADTDVVAVTVVTGEAWWAEVLTKALFLVGPAGLTRIDDAHAVIVTADGARYATPSLKASPV